MLVTAHLGLYLLATVWNLINTAKGKPIYHRVAPPNYILLEFTALPSKRWSSKEVITKSWVATLGNYNRRDIGQTVEVTSQKAGCL